MVSSRLSLLASRFTSGLVIPTSHVVAAGVRLGGGIHDRPCDVGHKGIEFRMCPAAEYHLHVEGYYGEVTARPPAKSRLGLTSGPATLPLSPRRPCDG